MLSTPKALDLISESENERSFFSDTWTYISEKANKINLEEQLHYYMVLGIPSQITDLHLEVRY